MDDDDDDVDPRSSNLGALSGEPSLSADIPAPTADDDVVWLPLDTSCDSASDSSVSARKRTSRLRHGNMRFFTLAFPNHW